MIMNNVEGSTYLLVTYFKFKFSSYSYYKRSLLKMYVS